MSIVEFLLARIAEEEALAHKVAERMEHVPPTTPGGIGDLGIVGYPFACVLAECQAKRAIIEEHRAIDMALTDYGADQVAEGTGQFQECLEDGGEYPCPTLRHLAAVYADHPDYDPAWRP